jgi:hypothetical protein
MMGMHANNDHAGLEATWRGQLRAELLPRPHHSSDNTSKFSSYAGKSFLRAFQDLTRLEDIN